jgi:hypothetical protein
MTAQSQGAPCSLYKHDVTAVLPTSHPVSLISILILSFSYNSFSQATGFVYKRDSTRTFSGRDGTILWARCDVPPGHKLVSNGDDKHAWSVASFFLCLYYVKRSAKIINFFFKTRFDFEVLRLVEGLLNQSAIFQCAVALNCISTLWFTKTAKFSCSSLLVVNRK